jgi:cytidine diphosphoramidate kinase
MIIWLVGQSAAGKTTIGRHLYKAWKQRNPDTVFIDGDEIRDVFRLNEIDDPYSVESRHKIAGMYHQMCVWLDKQGINVVCCTISNFQDVLDANRATFSDYFEVFVEVPFEVLKARDTKNLYESALSGKTKNVVGVDIPFSPPGNPDMVVDNSRDRSDLASVATTILAEADETATIQDEKSP